MLRIPQRYRDDRGDAAVEGAIYMLALFFLVGLILVAGRLTLARQALDHVAFQAARTASLQRTAGAAQAAATQEAADTLAAQKLDCISSSTSVDTTGFSAPLGEAANVTATTRCHLELSGLVSIIPGSIDLSATASSPIDTYRAR